MYQDLNKIGSVEQTRGSEPSQYPEEKKTISDSASSGERTRRSLNQRGMPLWGRGIRHMGVTKVEVS
jgi:hypothetical protein